MEKEQEYSSMYDKIVKNLQLDPPPTEVQKLHLEKLREYCRELHSVMMQAPRSAK